MKIEKNVMLSKSEIDRITLYPNWITVLKLCRQSILLGMDDVHIVRVYDTHNKKVGYALECWYGII